MPTAYQILLARVKQKIATEADWLAISDELGPIFEGEQCFVYNDEGLAVNFKVGDGTKKFSELPYFIAYMSGIANQKVLAYIDQTGNIEIPTVFRNKSYIQDVVLINNTGGSINIKIGTTDGGDEIFDLDIPVGVVSVDVRYWFQDSQTLYITNTDSAGFSIFILYLQTDESPVAPTGGAVTSSIYGYGTVYPFKPMYLGHTDASWDFLTGFGKVGTPYEGCPLFGTNGLDDLGDTYLIGYKIGDTLGGDAGSNEITLEVGQLPKFRVKLLSANVNHSGGDTPTADDTVARARSDGSEALNYEMVKGNAEATLGKSSEVGGDQPITIKPKSNIVLFFTGPIITT